MNNSLKIILSIVCFFSFAAFLNACSSTSDAITAVYKADRDNDGVVDAVYHYTFDIDENQIKVEIDSNNDGLTNKTCCYDLGAEGKNDAFKKIAGGG